MEKRRSGGMTAIAVLNITLGVLEILNGLFQLIGSLVLVYELVRLGVFEWPPARLFLLFYACGNGHRGISRGCRSLGAASVGASIELRVWWVVNSFVRLFVLRRPYHCFDRYL